MLPEFDASIEAVTLTLTSSTQEELPLCFEYDIVLCSLMCTAAYYCKVSTIPCIL